MEGAAEPGQLNHRGSAVPSPHPLSGRETGSKADRRNGQILFSPRAETPGFPLRNDKSPGAHGGAIAAVSPASALVYTRTIFPIEPPRCP